MQEPKKGRKPGLTWAGLLRRTFALDVFVNPLRARPGGSVSHPPLPLHAPPSHTLSEQERG
ncbi:MAG TPA: hypothetical protein VNA24_27485 [Hyalangium sp.]|nr:hypothetical protein [Hyalangium sp.]